MCCGPTTTTRLRGARVLHDMRRRCCSGPREAEQMRRARRRWNLGGARCARAQRLQRGPGAACRRFRRCSPSLCACRTTARREAGRPLSPPLPTQRVSLCSNLLLRIAAATRVSSTETVTAACWRSYAVERLRRKRRAPARLLDERETLRAKRHTAALLALGVPPAPHASG